ncbi:MAG: hydantoinase/carbamoylase family amidase, partial [Solirubrobacteraceae bacterium]
AEAVAMVLVAGWAREHGLEPGIDSHGNLWALPEGWDGPLVTAGSHVDTVPDGGRFDGALGTVLGLELVADLGDGAGVLICAAEEAPRFGAGTIGSRLLAGTLTPEALAAFADEEGITADRALAGHLEALSELPRVQPPLHRWHGHAEVHVAQRRALRTLGVVTSVASPRRFTVRVCGESGHSGEVTMEARHDALAAAAEVVLAVETAARHQPAQTVATVGTIAVSPGALSVIPGEARLGVDIRGISAQSLAAIEVDLRSAVEEIARRRGVAATMELVRGGDPVTMDRDLAQCALQAARELGLAAAETWSGAGHDAQHLAALVPALLLFVPLHGGESHTPQEGASMDEIVQAGRLIAAVMGTQALDRGSQV